jgi:VWFA-related protein
VSARLLLAAGVSVFAAASLGAQARRQPVFGASVETVHVDAFVTRGGSPVLGLAASDFELRDNGVVQQVELVASGSQPLLAVLAFDTSGSLAGEKLVALRAASQAFMAGLRPEDEVALITFSEELDRWIPPTRDRTRVLAALQRAEVGGATAVLDSLYVALTLPQTKARALVVLFTDGEDNMSWLDWRELQQVALQSNALLHVVGLRQAAGWAMCPIAEASGGRCWQASSLDRLKAAFSDIADTMSRRYVLRYEPQGVKRPGWHTLDVRLRGKRGELQARRGYWIADR